MSGVSSHGRFESNSAKSRSASPVPILSKSGSKSALSTGTRARMRSRTPTQAVRFTPVCPEAAYGLPQEASTPSRNPRPPVVIPGADGEAERIKVTESDLQAESARAKHEPASAFGASGFNSALLGSQESTIMPITDEDRLIYATQPPPKLEMVTPIVMKTNECAIVEVTSIHNVEQPGAVADASPEVIDPHDVPWRYEPDGPDSALKRCGTAQWPEGLGRSKSDSLIGSLSSKQSK